MSSRPSLDKVISYDTSSLLADIPERAQKENKNKSNVPDLKLSNRKAHSRPQTTKGAHQLTHKTINEEFNEKLIYHGTAKGVPTSELPQSRASALKNYQAASGTTAATDSVRIHVKTLARPPSTKNAYSNPQVVKPREPMAGRKRLASATPKNAQVQYISSYGNTAS